MADDEANVAQRLSRSVDHRPGDGSLVGPDVAHLDVLGEPILGHEALLRDDLRAGAGRREDEQGRQPGQQRKHRSHGVTSLRHIPAGGGEINPL